MPRIADNVLEEKGVRCTLQLVSHTPFRTAVKAVLFYEQGGTDKLRLDCKKVTSLIEGDPRFQNRTILGSHNMPIVRVGQRVAFFPGPREPESDYSMPEAEILLWLWEAPRLGV